MSALGAVLLNLRRSALRQEGIGPTDGELLDCFVRQRNEVAVEALGRLDGRMVPCRRDLGRMTTVKMRGDGQPTHSWLPARIGGKSGATPSCKKSPGRNF